MSVMRILSYRDGELALEVNTPEDALTVAVCMEKCAGFIRADLTAPKRKRSTGKYSQNHHLNGHIMQICRETGNDFSTVKLAVKEAAMETGYPYEMFRGKMYPVSEALSSTDECAMLIEAAHRIAAELGIYLVERNGE